MLQSVARVVLLARRGAHRRPARPSAPVAESTVAAAACPRPTGAAPRRIAGVSRPRILQRARRIRQGGREYVTILDAGHATPAPWINVIANPRLRLSGGSRRQRLQLGENSRENQLTPWSNDPVARPDRRGDLCSRRGRPAIYGARRPNPSATAATYIARHGHGYSRFEHQAHDIALELLQYVPLADPIKISRLTIAQPLRARRGGCRSRPMRNGCSACRAALRGRSS